MGLVRFDLRVLYSAVDAKRRHYGLSWADLSREVGVAASTIKRFADADDAEADGVLNLVRWVGSAPEHYIDGLASPGGPLPSGDQRYVRVDMELIARASGESGGARGRTRTTIQRLVAVAHASKQSVATLTRLSEV